MKLKTKKKNSHPFLHSSERRRPPAVVSTAPGLCLALIYLSCVPVFGGGDSKIVHGFGNLELTANRDIELISDNNIRLITDRENRSSADDIIFGFNGNASNFEEVMRLNEDGRLNLKLNEAGGLHLMHYRTIQITKGGPQPYGRYSTPPVPYLRGSFTTSPGPTPGHSGWFPDGDQTHHFELLLRGSGFQGSSNMGMTSLKFNLGGGDEMLTAMEMYVPASSAGLAEGHNHGARSNQEKTPRTALGFYDYQGNHDRETMETLEVNGAIRIKGSFGDHAGTIRYHGGHFQGRNDSTWVNLGQDGSAVSRFGHSVNFSRGLQLGNTDSTVLGAMRFHDGDFEGYDGAGWVSLTESELTRSTRTDRSTDDIYLDDGHFGGDVLLTAEDSKLVFGVTGREGEIQDNYLVNSLYAPRDDDRPNFPNTGQIYADDVDSSGGVTLVTKGHSRFTVSHAGTAYFHNKVAVGIGNMVEGSQMTVAGAVHIGPSDTQPTTFDYSDELDNYLLWVENGIVSEDFAIANVDNWSDHVFDEDYDLMSLENVAEHIEASGHLPGVPSASEVAENGYTVHGMTRILLEKIEELTLHTIEQDSAIRELRTELNQNMNMPRIEESVPHPGRHSAPTRRHSRRLR